MHHVEELLTIMNELVFAYDVAERRGSTYVIVTDAFGNM